MQNLADISDYRIEASQKIGDNIPQAADLHRLIPEESVRDLMPVYVAMGFYCKFKRIMDILLSLIGLFLLLIPFVVLSIMIYADDPGTVFFSQYRVGRRGKLFKLYKFRTMRTSTPKYISTMEVHNPQAHITRVGRTLRKLSLDELPQLINVIKGDMSLVGPRPLIPDEYEIHAMRMRFGVYSIRPGMTGLAQIHGRDLVPPADKVRWDVKYLQDFGFRTDLKILFATIPKIFHGEGVVEGAYLQKTHVKQSLSKEEITE